MGRGLAINTNTLSTETPTKNVGKNSPNRSRLWKSPLKLEIPSVTETLRIPDQKMLNFIHVRKFKAFSEGQTYYPQTD